MENVLNSGSLETLKQGQVLLTQLRQVSGGKIQMEFAEVKESSSGLNPVFLFNKSDSRFTSNSARRAWQNGQPSDVEEMFNLPGICGNDQAWYQNEKGHTVLDMNVLNPSLIYDGQPYPIRVQIQETIEGDEWQISNTDTAAKRKGKGGDFILHNGNYIFTNSTIVIGQEPQDIFLKPDTIAASTSNVVQAEGVEVDTLTGEIFN
jgi:hypothetical protein